MKREKRKLKTMALMVAMAAGMLLPTALNAQDSFQNQGFGSSSGGFINQGFGTAGGSGSFSNQGFGATSNGGFTNQSFGHMSESEGNFTNQTFGGQREAPLGSGILIMLAAGAGYAALKRKRVESGV